MGRALADEVSRFDPQLIVPVFSAGAAARLRGTQPDLRSAVIMTDSFAHRLWVHENTDRFVVTSSLAAESVRRFWGEAAVEVVEAPVRAGFSTPPTRDRARQDLGVAHDRTCVLLIAGAWGLGPLDAAAERLSAEGHSVLAVAGTNETLERRLRELSRRAPGGSRCSVSPTGCPSSWPPATS